MLAEGPACVQAQLTRRSVRECDQRALRRRRVPIVAVGPRTVMARIIGRCTRTFG